MRLYVITFLFLISSCSVIDRSIGLGPSKKSPEEQYHEIYGTKADYPNIKEVENISEVENCIILGRHQIDSSWSYPEMKLMFYKFVNDKQGNVFIRDKNVEQAGLLSELNRYRIRYFKCEN